MTLKDSEKNVLNQISIKDFSKLIIQVGTIVGAEKVPDTDKLIRLEVDFGLKPSNKLEGSLNYEDSDSKERDIRQIVSGIADKVSVDYLIGKQCPFVTNLEPRSIRGVESNGMILAASSADSFSLLHPHEQIENGSKVK